MIMIMEMPDSIGPLTISNVEGRNAHKLKKSYHLSIIYNRLSWNNTTACTYWESYNKMNEKKVTTRRVMICLNIIFAGKWW